MTGNVPLSNATVNILQGTYFDDYDENKKFYRILFRPSTAVQARELTQLQAIIQNQISRFGDHIFKDGSVVTGCAPVNRQSTDFVRVIDSFANGYTILPGASVEDLDDTYTITNGKDSNTAVRAKLFFAKKGFKSNYPDTNRFYVQYVFTGKDGSNNDVATFSNGEILYIYNANQQPLANLSNTNIVGSINVYTTNATANAAIGVGYIVSVTDGVIYQKGFFQKVDRQYAIVSNFDSNANSQLVGFETVESIVTEYQDVSLNDNANGSSNYNAPGAHRLKLTPTLVVKSKTELVENKNFFPIIEFDNNTAVMASKDNVYSAIGDVLSKRTYEESGDYVITPHSIETTANTSDANTFNYEISPGVSYIKGSRVELIGTRRITSYRANTTQIVQNKILTANYGNFVYCKEVLGAMNFDKLGEVVLYDTAFTAISDREGLSGGTSGNIVGYANIKSVVYYSGTRGTSEAQYYVYLFNIRMNTGKNFQNDVKSIYYANAAGYTKFKADLILESSKAVLYDATLTPMVFDTGYQAIKSLTPTGGVRDTTFYYRKTTSSTLNANGFMSFTLSGGLGAAGTEQIYNTDSREYNIILAANAYSANVVGTITANTALANSTAANIVGSSTTFEASLKVGDTIRLSNTGGTAALFKVSAIYSNTLMSVTPNVTVNAVSNTYQRYFQDGHIFNITDSMLSVTPLSNTFTISTGITFDSGSGSTVYAQYPVAKSPAVQAAKTVGKNRLVKIDCSNNAATSIGPWCLGLPDVIKINNIWIGSSSTYSNTTANRSAWFRLNNGQNDDSYDLSTISIDPTYKSNITGTSTILVDLNHFVSNTDSGIGYYSIDSYPIYTDGINSNSTTIAIADIPIFKSKTSGKSIDLRNAIDFRPVKAATANSVANTNPANTLITINPAVSNSNTWSISTYGQYHPEVDSQFTADYEYYIPRYDLVLLGPTGTASVANGMPDIFPKKPLNVSDASVIAEAYVPPFPSLTMREAAAANRFDLSTKITLKTNRRYTMRDIGVLEDRIAKLEYYTVLSILEKQAKDVSIGDSTGKDRFKNGIFADPFNSHALGNPGDIEYKISIDPSKSIARPAFNNHYIDFQYNSSNSTNITQKGPFLMLPYNHEQFAQQSYATNYRVCTESLWSWKGSAVLAPSQDIFQNETIAPAINNTIDLAKGLQDLAGSGFINTQIFGKQSSKSLVDQKISVVEGGGGVTTTTDTTTTTTTSQDVSKLQISTTNKEYNMGTSVIDVSSVNYMRQIDIAFYSKNMKPNTKLHVFFDGIKVDDYITPGILNTDIKDFTYNTKEKNIVTATASKGTALSSNSSGCVAGIFTVPAGQFLSGERRLLITNVDDLVAGASSMLTKSEATFYSSGLAVTKQSSTLTTINPVIFTSQETVTNTVVTKNHIVDFVPDAPPDPPTPPDWSGPINDPISGNGDGGGGDDPIAQSFMITVPNDSSGQFISKIDLYFKAKDTIKGVTVFLVVLTNGVPDFSKILGSAHLDSSGVNISENAQTSTTFEFDHPIYVSSQNDYAFVVEPDGRSPEYLIWTAETGGFDIYNGIQVYENPYDGIMFVSANRKSWTSIQKEDIKFKLYRARFNQGTGTAAFNNEDDEYLTLTGIVKANTRNISVGDVVYTSNSTVANTAAGAPFGIVQYYDEINGTLVLDSTRAGFSNTVGSERIQIHRIQPTSNTSLSYSTTLTDTIIAYANVVSVDNSKYHIITPKFAIMQPQNTNLNFALKGTDTSYNFDSSWKNVSNEDMNEIFDKERIVMSRSNELAFSSNNKSTFFQATFTSADSLVSPIIDLRRKSSYFIENLINNDYTNEQFTYGNSLSKYISKKVVLADGQDAEDLRVYLTATRPINSDIKVYAKFLGSDDPEEFSTKLWTPLSYLNASDSVYTSQGKVDDFIEYEFGVPAGTSLIQSFNGNTSVSNTAETITFTTNAFVNNQIVLYYTASGNTAPSGLSNNTFYYVVGAGATTLQLSASQGGSAINLTSSTGSGVTEIGHYLKGYVASIARTAFTNPDNSNIVEYYNNSNSRISSYKYFAIKVVLLSSDRVNIPRLNDLRAIALQI
jgi:hypothetical protein